MILGIEKASLVDVAELRHKLRHAPPSWLAAVDQVRVDRGLEPLVKAPARRSTATASSTKQPPRRSCGTLAVSCCPGTSLPTAAAGDPAVLPEYVEPGAWTQFLADVKAGKRTVELQDGHGRLALASTADGTLRLSVDERLGLLAEADLADTPYDRLTRREIEGMAAGCPVSVMVFAEDYSHAKRGGTLCRIIRRARIAHVALLRPATGDRPAYRDARAIAVPAGDARALRAAWTRIIGR